MNHNIHTTDDVKLPPSIAWLIWPFWGGLLGWLVLFLVSLWWYPPARFAAGVCVLVAGASVLLAIVIGVVRRRSRGRT